MMVRTRLLAIVLPLLGGLAAGGLHGGEPLGFHFAGGGVVL